MEDVFVEIALKRPKYSEKSSFKTWLFAIARYTYIDRLKKNSRYYDVPVDEMHNISDEQDLEKSYICKEQRIRIHKALSRLIPDYHQVLYLIFFEDFSNSEAAQIMKKSDKQIKNLVYRAKQALKKELEKDDYEYEEL